MKIVLGVVASVFLFVAPVSAHVGVKPNQAAPAAFQTFTVGVPVEKEIATVGLRLTIPEGLNHVTPNVKPGWTISTQKSGEGDTATITEISWTGGTIPAGQRDEFIFSAQVPARETTVPWKAYQTYADGSVVSWDQEPGTDVIDGKGPYSQTKVTDTNSQAPASHAMSQTALVLSIIAILAVGVTYLPKKS